MSIYFVNISRTVHQAGRWKINFIIVYAKLFMYLLVKHVFIDTVRVIFVQFLRLAVILQAQFLFFIVPLIFELTTTTTKLHDN